jgi:hypothetical protein
VDALTAVVLLLLAPPVTAADLDRFPPPWLVQEQLQFNLACRERLETMKRFSPHRATELDLAVAEFKRACWPWCYLVCARNYGDQLGYLDTLRGMIGPRDYALGRMPPVVPPGLFEPLD